MGAREIESLAEFDRLVGAGATSMRGWHLQDLDLTGHGAVLARLDPRGAMLLGCRLPDGAADALHNGGAVLFPPLPDLPFDPYRARLYTSDELYAGLDTNYADTFDARVYAWAQRVEANAIGDTLAQALHDHAVDDALGEHVHGARIVGVMGGHNLSRDDPAYAEAARLGHQLSAAGLTVATGGGPGAMEAANLGGRLGEEAAEAVEIALTMLAGVPSYQPSVTAWARSGFAALAEMVTCPRSLGVPTWFYGHEPPNVFAAAVAKYFRNSIREDVLLGLSNAGIVFLPGAAGTVQEIFQAACEDYYADAQHVVPMVLIGRDYWTERLPAWPLLGALVAGRAAAGSVYLVDRTEEVLPVLVDEPRSQAG